MFGVCPTPGPLSNLFPLPRMGKVIVDLLLEILAARICNDLPTRLEELRQNRVLVGYLERAASSRLESTLIDPFDLGEMLAVEHDLRRAKGPRLVETKDGLAGCLQPQRGIQPPGHDAP